MTHDPALLKALEGRDHREWRGRAFRHMLGAASPALANVHGARWNPPGTAALYMSLHEDTAKAEGDRLIAVQPVPPRAPRTIYELEVAVRRLLDLSDEDELRELGLDRGELRSDDFAPCQRVGAAVAWLGYDGMLVPSVRDEGRANLVLYTDNRDGSVPARVRGQRRL